MLGSIAFFPDKPSKTFSEICETLLANPVILILGAITLVQHAGKILNHKLCSTKRTMVVVPICILRVATILAMEDNNTI